MFGPDNDEWYSDEALQKQAAIDRMILVGEQPPLSMFVGMLEPRVPPTPEEQCSHCTLDARSETGGEIRNGKRWCFLCISRGRHESW